MNSPFPDSEHQLKKPKNLPLKLIFLKNQKQSTKPSVSNYEKQTHKNTNSILNTESF